MCVCVYVCVYMCVLLCCCCPLIPALVLVRGSETHTHTHTESSHSQDTATTTAALLLSSRARDDTLQAAGGAARCAVSLCHQTRPQQSQWGKSSFRLTPKTRRRRM
ncbi:hypothetical protein DPEC_G00182910 [Dallia pectoralis]|uniref:Uncharacterized protein n=1 Tax=Dallia pectoralis TaxID=75939 RepID=A0ACC2GAK1_DALPE|nr:hypothetical protein DPEC_G00182910 [Dallia pectoralis]